MTDTDHVVERNRVTIRPVVGEYESVATRKKLSPHDLFQQEVPELLLKRRKICYLPIPTDDDPGTNPTMSNPRRSESEEVPTASPPLPTEPTTTSPPTATSSTELGPSRSKPSMAPLKKKKATMQKEGPQEDRATSSGRIVKDPDRLIYHM
jgi:hypothetical protein